MKSRTVYAIIGFLAIVVLAIYSVLWLAISAITMLGIYLGLTRIKNPKLYIFLSFLSIAFLAIFFRLFIVELFTVPSESMEDALFPHDNIAISKLYYGPRLPASRAEIPWVNAAYTTAKNEAASPWWGYQRLNGISTIKRGDLLVFQTGRNSGIYWVKRCIGLPGDRVQIKSARVYINDKAITEAATVKKVYKIFARNISDFLMLEDVKKMKSTVIRGENGSPDYIISKLTDLQKKRMEALGVDSIKVSSNSEMAYPFDPKFKWSPDNFGPLSVPKKDLTILLDPEKYKLFKHVFDEYERAGITEKSGKFYQNGTVIDSYKFKYDYYFMMGDNRGSSGDSRFWGVLSEINIEGKVVMKF